MKDQYNFKGGKRGAIISSSGKERITIRLDKDVIDYFRELSDSQGRGGYQTLINEVLRSYMRSINGRAPDNIQEHVSSDIRNAIASLAKDIARPVSKTAKEESTLADVVHSGYALYWSVKKIVDDAVLRSGIAKESQFRSLFREEFLSPSPRLIDAFVSKVVLECAFFPSESAAEKAFREFMLSIAVTEVLDESAFSSSLLKPVYEKMATESEVRGLSLRGFLSLLSSAAGTKSEYRA